MSQWDATTRRLTAVLGVETDARSETATVRMEEAGGSALALVLDMRALGALGAALASAQNQLMEALPEGEWPAVQTLEVSQVLFAQNPAGQNAMLLDVEGLGLIPFLLDEERVRQLASGSTEVLTAISDAKN